MDFKSLLSFLLQRESSVRSLRELHLESNNRDSYHGMQAKRKAEEVTFRLRNNRLRNVHGRSQGEFTLNRKETRHPGCQLNSIPVLPDGKFIPAGSRAAISPELILGRKVMAGMIIPPSTISKSTTSRTCNLGFNHKAETRVIVSPNTTVELDTSLKYCPLRQKTRAIASPDAAVELDISTKSYFPQSRRILRAFPKNESVRTFPNLKSLAKSLPTLTPESEKRSNNINRKRGFDTGQDDNTKKSKQASSEGKTVVKHNYRDYSCSLRMHRSIKYRPEGNLRLYPGAQFPEKVHYILEKSSRAGLTSIFEWKSHGRAFCVNDTKAFEASILPMYFKHGKWASFLRQLNLYGFKRLTKGPDEGSYYHELFLRGLVKLSRKMYAKRDKVIYKAVSNQEDEPDFYAMSRILPVYTLANNKERIHGPSVNKVKKVSTDDIMNACSILIAIKGNKNVKGKTSS